MTRSLGVRAAPSPAGVRYLRATYLLSTGHGRARAAALARWLGVSRAGVGAMLARLRAAGLVVSRGGGTALTPDGRRLARAALRSYCVAHRFLQAELGLDWDAAQEQAERCAAALTPTIEGAMRTRLRRAPACPRIAHAGGDPLRGGDCPAGWPCLRPPRPGGSTAVPLDGADATG